MSHVSNVSNVSNVKAPAEELFRHRGDGVQDGVRDELLHQVQGRVNGRHELLQDPREVLWRGLSDDQGREGPPVVLITFPPPANCPLNLFLIFTLGNFLEYENTCSKKLDYPEPSTWKILNLQKGY